MTSPDAVLDAIFDPARRGDLYSHYRTLRASWPVFKSDHPAIAGSWVLTGAPEVSALLRRYPFNSPEADAAQIYNLGDGGPFYETMRTMMHNLESGDHSRLRRLVGPAFATKAVALQHQLVEEVVTDLIDAVAPKGEMELIREFAHPFPARVILTMMAIPDEDHDALAGYADDFIRRLDVGDSLTEEVIERGDAAAQFLQDYFAGLLALRRRSPGNDLISLLMAAAEGEDALASEEIVSTAIVIFEGGHQTTSNAFGTAMAALLADAEETDRFRHNPEMTANACEELLRYD
jgi:cytochrome P450